MIRKIQIKNFKSIVDMELNLGRFNVLIGENGGGKSNVLEAIGIAGISSMSEQLKVHVLRTRGIRTGPESSYFTKFSGHQAHQTSVNIVEDPTDIKSNLSTGNDRLTNAFFIDLRQDLLKRIPDLLKSDSNSLDAIDLVALEAVKQAEAEGLTADEAITTLIDIIKTKLKKNFHDYSGFVLFSPQAEAIRDLNPEEESSPVAYNGKGTIFHLGELIQTSNFQDGLSEFLSILDWFHSIQIIEDSTGVKILFKDRYIPQDSHIELFHANEAMLFLLFYYVLFTSPDTPKFFAIDNIEASFNPKLCRKVIRELYKLAVKHDKQVIFTTHNPFILDGLNLEDPEQKLFTIERSIDGPTMAYPMDRPIQGPRKIPLSEAWMMGLLGGLPNNF